MESGADLIVVRRSPPLSGEVTIPGAKNSVLKLMAAALLGHKGESTLTNVPAIADVDIMGDLLAAIGMNTEWHPTKPGTLVITHDSDLIPVAPYELVERIRASINVLGPLLTRCGKVKLSMPGGDDFGSRPIDMHLKGLEQMGASFVLRHGYVEAVCDRLRGAHVIFEFPSVGATENVLTAAVFAKGTTVIDNAAREPEISDLCNFLNKMGADIEGVGSSTLVIHGVERDSLRAVTHDVVPDRLQAATFLAAAAVTGGNIIIRGARSDHMEIVLRRLNDMGMQIDVLTDGFAVAAPERLRAIDVATLPYPGVATDYKPFIVTMLAVADGVSIVTENLYPGRFRYVEELQRLGADIHTDGHHAVVRGVKSLSGAPVKATDIRAGAALVIAGLFADGETVISGVDHIDRGYDDLVGRLQGLGADIDRTRGL
jgi:UDP-N-acetylglucosamine 1-carboxyvinyltransferase